MNSGTPARARLIGQPTLAAIRVLSKRQLVEPRDPTDRDKGDFRDGRRPGKRSSVTVTCVCTECDGRPAWAKISESAMEKQHSVRSRDQLFRVGLGLLPQSGLERKLAPSAVSGC